MRIIDITQELFTCTVYAGDTAPEYKRVRTMPDSAYNLTDITLCVHNGTHVDAPRHFIADGAAIDEIDLGAFYGECKVAEFDGSGSIEPLLANTERLLLKGFSAINAADAQKIASSGIKLVGVEAQSVGPENAPAEVHRILLGAGVILLEGLRLEAVEPGGYTLCALPLKLGGSDGSPVRAVLIEL